MDEKTLRNIIKESFQQFLNPVEKKIDKKLQELEKSVQFMSTSFEEQKLKFEEVLEELKIVKKENQDLKQRLQKMESKVDDMELKEKQNNIVVVGVPKQRNADTKIIMDKILTSMGLEEHKNKVQESFRIKNVEDGPILVKFSSVDIKKEVIRKVKQLRGLKLNTCGLSGEDRNIYLNEDLTIAKSSLFKKVREIKLAKGYKAAFIANGIIYLKKNDRDPGIKIRSEDDLPK